MNDRKLIALRADPATPDELDGERVNLVLDRWKSQDQAHTAYNRMVEEHVRMLAGRQWDVYSEVLGRYVDALRYMSADERRWRQRPVMDYLGYWYMVTLSKATENMPLVGFLPSTADHLDAQLAEVMDPVFKTLWDEVEMPEKFMQAAAWCLVAGEAYMASRAEYNTGPMREMIGDAVLKLEREDGSEIERVAEGVPFDEDANPLAELVEGEDGDFGFDVTGEPHAEPEGEIKVDVYCPLEIRAQWGSHIAWSDKRWIIHRWFLTPDQVQERYGIEVEADAYADDEAGGPGYLERLLFGSGYFGAARQDMAGTGSSENQQARAQEGFVCGYTMWEKPDAKLSPATEDSPGGRLLVIGGGKCLWDSARPYKTECAGPIRQVAFLTMPGRPFKATPLEKIIPLQKRLNRVEAQIAEHTNLCTNPVLLVTDGSGIDGDSFVARPGLTLTHDYQGPGDPAKWLSPPSLSNDVWRHRQSIIEQMMTIGSLTGNQGESQGTNPSGELIQQLRYNADRPLSPLTRSLELAAAGVAEDWMAIIPTVWTDERVINYAGEDSVLRTVTVLPEMWDGSVNVRPIMESAAPETREKRQERVLGLYQMGAFGEIGSPPAIKRLLELSRFPELSRAARPGGIHRVMAEHNMAKLVRGEEAETIPILEVYDLVVHLEVLEEFMAGPEYLALAVETQEQFEIYRGVLKDAGVAKQIGMEEDAGDLAVVQGVLAEKVRSQMPVPPEMQESEGMNHDPTQAPRQDSRAA